MALGIERRSELARVEFQVAVAELAERYGFGLHFADRRQRRPRGDWFKIRGFDAAEYARHREEHREEDGDVTPRLATTLTNVGPARSGVAHAVAAELYGMRAGLLGTSVNSLQGVGFSTFYLPVVQDVEPGPVSGGRSRKGEMRRVRWLCTHTPPESVQRGAMTPDGYSLVLGPVAPCRLPEPASALAGRAVSLPLWVSWELPGSVIDAATLLRRLSEVLTGRSVEHELVYAQSRLVSPDVMAGRAKVAVRIPAVRKGVPSRDPDELCSTIEEELLGWATGLGVGRGHCRVSTRERWL
jgi:hypothetical protein